MIVREVFRSLAFGFMLLCFSNGGFAASTGIDLPEPSQLPASDLEAGISALFAKDYQSAFDLLLPLAIEGDAEAQVRIGDMYYYGSGLPKDGCLAVFWIAKAARQLPPQAAMDLSGFYNMGNGVLDDQEMAYRWAYWADKLGHPKAQDEMEYLWDLELTPEQKASIEHDIATWDPTKLPPPELFFYSLPKDVSNERYATLRKRTGVGPCRFD